jgi:hypothetical protein
MSDGRGDERGAGAGGAPDLEAIAARLDRVRDDLDAIDERAVDREAFEDDLRRYVRRRMRRGHARGWGPYLVLLYGAAMTIGAFHYLDGGWAIAAMVVVWLSTLGLYTLMVLVGAGFAAAGGMRGALGRLRER